MTRNEFAEQLKAHSLELSEEQLDGFETYLKQLQKWNQKMNLTAITDEEEIWQKHFFDSIIPLLGTEFETLCDVGSGAGFPGVPAAIVWPQRKITLVEPLEKRCRFLNHIKDTLKLDNLEVVNARAEDYAAKNRERFDEVTARAVARLSILLELCIPLLKRDGIFTALKGPGALDELEQAEPALKELNVKLDHEKTFDLDGAGRNVLYFRRDGKLPAKYPRAYSQIKKKPLEK